MREERADPMLRIMLTTLARVDACACARARRFWFQVNLPSRSKINRSFIFLLSPRFPPRPLLRLSRLPPSRVAKDHHMTTVRSPKLWRP